MKIECIYGDPKDPIVIEVQRYLNVPVLTEVASSECVLAINSVTPETFCVTLLTVPVPTQMLEQMQLLVSPYYHIVEYCRSNGYWCEYIPFRPKSKHKMKLDGSRLGTPILTLDLLLNATERLLVYETDESLRDWSVALKKPFDLFVGNFKDFCKQCKSLIVPFFDHELAIEARALGLETDKKSIVYSTQWKNYKIVQQICLRDEFMRYGRVE